MEILKLHFLISIAGTKTYINLSNSGDDLIYFTTQAPETSDMNATHMGQQRHECDTSENFDFDNDTSDDTSENIFSYPCIYYMVSERLKGVEQFHSKNYLF